MSVVLALVMVVLIALAQWFFTSRTLASPSHYFLWVTGGYLAKILLLAVGLYVPRALGMDVRLAAVATILTIIVASTAETYLLMRSRVWNVDPPADTEVADTEVDALQGDASKRTDKN